MKIHSGLVGQRLHEVVDQQSLEVADALLLDSKIVVEVGTAADIDHRGAERLVERHGRITESSDPRAVAQRLSESAAEHDADIFNGMMLVDVEIAGGLDLEVEEAV